GGRTSRPCCRLGDPIESQHSRLCLPSRSPRRVEGVVRRAGTDAVDKGLGLAIAVIPREGSDTCGRWPGDIHCHVTPCYLDNPTAEGRPIVNNMANCAA